MKALKKAIEEDSIMIRLLFAVLSATLGYLAGAFLDGSFDPRHWDAFAALLAVGTFYGLYSFISDVLDVKHGDYML